MLKLHYPALLADDPAWASRSQAFAGKVHELVAFLVDVRGVTEIDAAFSGTVTYHDSCSSLREMGVAAQPRALLGTVAGLSLTELRGTQECCGFGGTFCIKYPEISNAIAEKKTAAIAATGAGTVLAGDLGCLLNIAGKLKRQGSAVESRHVAEVLAGMTDLPAIGEAGRSA
jgi:L-lactate dehydrogenase complex protein LldE